MTLAQHKTPPAEGNDVVCRGWWHSPVTKPERGYNALRRGLLYVARPLFVLEDDQDVLVSHEGSMLVDATPLDDTPQLPIVGYVPGMLPENLGDTGFKSRYNLRYAYIVGAMANGISSVSMVESAGRRGMMGFFGAGGLSLTEISSAIDQLKRSHQVQSFPFGMNFIHSPTNSVLEMETAKLYLRKKIRLVSASAFMAVTLPLTFYRLKGVRKTDDGRILCPNRIIAKISREEVARQFLSPPPPKHVDKLLGDGFITPEEAKLATRIPMADDITAEADSGGHTDNRPALALLPTIMAVRDTVSSQYDYQSTPCVGLAGGIATPAATAAAFAMGAAFVLTGSVNQACKEAGTSLTTRQMLAQAGQADVMMAPAADMFELGVNVQVLKRGTLFPLRARKLHDLYSRYDAFEDLPENEQRWIEETLLRKTFNEEWAATKQYFLQRAPHQVEKAASNPKHRMALVFRSYLGQASHWANTGISERQLDYQIWCGPGMGAFNEWAKGSFLEDCENREAATIAINFLFGATVINRFQQIRTQGLNLPTSFMPVSPMHPDEINQYLAN